MIKFMATRDGRKILGLVLTEENVTRLRGGEPITFHAEDIRKLIVEFQDFIMFYASDDRAALRIIEEHSLIDSETEIRAAKKSH